MHLQAATYWASKTLQAEDISVVRSARNRFVPDLQAADGLEPHGLVEAQWGRVVCVHAQRDRTGTPSAEKSQASCKQSPPEAAAACVRINGQVGDPRARMAVGVLVRAVEDGMAGGQDATIVVGVDAQQHALTRVLAAEHEAICARGG